MGCCGSKQTGPLVELVLAIFGPDNAGKTCFLRALAGDFDFKTVPSVGLGQKTFIYQDVQLKIYDLGGNSNFRRVWSRFFAEIWGFVYIVDSSDPARFDEAKEVLDGVTGHMMMTGKPLVVVANKQDCEGAVPIDELRERLGLASNVSIYSTIATEVTKDKCHAGVDEAISELIASVLGKYDKLHEKVGIDMQTQSEIDAQESAEKMARLERRREEAAAQNTSSDAATSKSSQGNDPSTNVESEEKA